MMSHHGAIAGLKVKYAKLLIEILSSNPRVERVVLFGSRATGSYTKTSDIDLVLYGQQLTLSDLARLSREIELTTIPHKVDLVAARLIEDRDLLDHIDRHGLEVWQRPSRG